MRNKKKLSIIDLLPAIMSAILFLVVLAFTIFLFNLRPLLAVILSIIGLILNYVTGVAVHEAGHVAAAKKYKMRLVFVNLGIFSVDYVNAKIIPFTLFKRTAGETSFLPTEETDEKQIKSIAAHGLLYSLVFFLAAIIISVVVSILTGHAEPICLISAGQAANYYILSLNALSTDKSSDGSVAFGNGKYARVLAYASNVERQIQMGETPTENDEFISDNEPIALYLHYLFTVHGGNGKTAANELSRSISVDRLNDAEFNLIYPELVFNLAKRGVEKDELYDLAEDFFATAPNTVSVLRAHYAYRRVKGDAAWAETLEKSYKAQLEKAPPFAVETERILTE